MKQNITMCLMLAAFLSVAGLQAATAAILRVDIASTATNPDGSDWDGSPGGNCYKFLQDALAVAIPNDEIRIAHGTQHPDESSATPLGSGSRTASFVMRSRVVIKGGFKGTVGFADGTADDRDPAVFVTILSGDLDDNDDPTVPLDQDQTNRAENSLTVVDGGVGTTSTSELDGVTIRDGHGGANVFSGGGAGVYVPLGSSPTFRNCIITRNWVSSSVSVSGGGGMLIAGGNTSTIDGCLFLDNQAATGGALRVNTGSGTEALPVIRNCEFRDNVAAFVGGGVDVVKATSPKFEDCLFVGNQTGGAGAVGELGGGGLHVGGFSSVELRRCRFECNQALDGLGGGIHMDSSSDVTVIDSMFVQNMSTSTATNTSVQGGAVFLPLQNGLQSNFINCVFDRNAAEAPAGGLRSQGGAVFLGFFVQQPVPLLQNCLFIGNSADEGAGIYTFHAPGLLVNCTFSGNAANLDGGGVYISPSGVLPPLTLTNCILWGNQDNCGTTCTMDQSAQIFEYGIATAVVTYSCIQDDNPDDGSIPFPGGANIDDDPMFADAARADLRLSSCSPCIDRANSTPVPADQFDVDGDMDPNELTPDLDRLDRALDDPETVNQGAGTPDFVDMGVYEFQPHTVLFVDDDVQTSGTGFTWGTAFRFLQDALYEASLSPVPVEVHVAGGIYRPDEGVNVTSGDRKEAFAMHNGVSIKGGYAGLVAPQTPCLRDTQQYATLLGGDIGTVNDDTDNSYHVVTGSGTDATAMLDGVWVVSGNADGVNPNNKGGGMFNSGGSPTVRFCRFYDNAAAEGGGMYNQASSPMVTHCEFRVNSATGTFGGGAMLNVNGSQPVVDNCLFAANSTPGNGGGMLQWASQPTITNCTVANNSAGVLGGGIDNEAGSTPTITNCILWANADSTGATESGQIHDSTGANPSQSTVTYSCIQGLSLFNDPTNVGLDPLFVDPAFGQQGGNLHLSTGSPCIDAGNNDADLDANLTGVQTLPLLDLDGNPRRVDDPSVDPDPGNVGMHCPPVVDMGVYEFDPSGPGLAQHGSKVVHGSAGEYFIESDEVECRDIQGAITVVFVFDEPIYSADGDAFVPADFTLINGASPNVVQPDDRTLEVSCINVLDEQCFGISFTVENAAGNEAALDFAWPILAGDADGDGLVDTDDADLVTLSNSDPLDENNFRCDLDMDGVIEGEAAPPGDDRAIVDAADGHGLLPCQPVVTKQVSRKQHGRTSYDIADGGVEPRTGDLLLMFTFDRVMRSLDDDNLVPADFTISSGTVTKVAAGWDWSTIKVTVAGASDAAAFTISFDAEDEDGFATHTEACWSMLVGDVDGDGATTASDTAAIQAANRAAITSSNFRCDIDANGQIAGAVPDTTDYDLADANVGQTTGGCN